jgi:hypothetical protein
MLVGVVAATQTAERDKQPTSTGPVSATTVDLSTSLLRQHCIEFKQVKLGDKPADIRDCRVSEFGEFGTVDEVHYYYALYCLIPNDAPDKGHCDDGSFNARYHRTRGLAIFLGDSSGLKVRLLIERVEEIGTMQYDPPQIIRNGTGTILYLPIAIDGTGHYNASEYFLWDAGKWQPIESQGWLKNLSQQMPTGLEIWKGVWPDLRTMQTEVGLYRGGDANCCPTGGRARIRFSIRERRFVLDSVAFERPE